MTNAAFLVTAPARGTERRAALTLAQDRITVASLHVEDSDGQPLDVHGSLARTSCASAISPSRPPRATSR